MAIPCWIPIPLGHLGVLVLASAALQLGAACTPIDQRHVCRGRAPAAPVMPWTLSMIRSDRRRRQCDAIRRLAAKTRQAQPCLWGGRPEMMKQASLAASVAAFSKAISTGRGQPRNSAIFIATPSPEGFGIIPRDASSWSLHGVFMTVPCALFPQAVRSGDWLPLVSDLPLRRFCLSLFLVCRCVEGFCLNFRTSQGK